MPRIAPIDVAAARGDTAQALAAVKAKLGKVPNMFATLALSPAALATYFNVADALEKGRFSARQRELVALAVAQENDCGYCLAAHAAIGGMLGLQPTDVEAARAGRAANARDAAIVALAQAIVRSRGNPSAAEIAAARVQLGDADILETIAVATLNIFTNYVNHIAGTEIDFPQLASRKAA